MKIERQLQGTLNTIFSDIIRGRKLENKIQAFPVLEENRADITLKRSNGNPIFFIELKDPTANDGRSVFDSNIIIRELERAQKLEIRYFGNCNFLACAFFDSHNIKDKVSVGEGFFTTNDISRLSKNYVVTKEIEKKLRSVAEFYLERALEIISRKAITFSQPDELYIFKIRKLIEAYSYSVTDKVWKKYNEDKKFEKQIQNYTSSQLWNFPKTFEEIENLTHIALLMLISKIIFYKAYVDNQTWHNLSPMQIGNDIETSAHLENKIWEYFTEFKDITGDYELLIGERSDIIFQIPFVSDSVLELVKDILETDRFYDFSKIPYDIIGRIFEELIREDERHKLGQYFTPPYVIDVINAFAINNENDKVFDPSCGSGTFLVRAYERKKKLSMGTGKSSKRHEILLNEIYGNDLSGYPAYLSILNLSIRNTRRKSYPKIINKDFFAIMNFTAIELYNQDGKKEKKQLPQFNAIIGNPPYTRQEDIGVMQGTIKKDEIQALVKAECGFKSNQQTGIYAYFFYHAFSFLKEGGILAYVVQNSWMETSYGMDLQKYFLKNFEIIAIMDSEVERFFPSAAVNTSIVILRKQKEEEKRNKNTVRFIYFKNKIVNALKFYGNEDKLKKAIVNNDGASTNKLFRINCINQKQLEKFNKWGQFLRAPQIYFDILNKGGYSFKNLSGDNGIANIYYGLKSGCNEYFFGTDVTELKDEAFISACINNIDGFENIRESKQNGLRIFKNGLDECWLIEKEFLEKALKLTRAIRHYIIDKVNPNGVIFYLNKLDKYKEDEGYDIKKYRKELKENYPYAYSYIQHGEKAEFKGSTVAEKPSCSGRPAWWDLGEQGKKDFILLRFRDRRNWLPIVETDFLLGDVAFFGNYKNRKFKKHYSINLNSTFSILQSEMLGRVNLGDGLLTTYGPDLEAMQVLDIIPNKQQEKEIETVYKLLRGIEAISIFDELGTEDESKLKLSKVVDYRYRIDDLFLKLLGYSDKKEREKVLTELYQSVIKIIKGRIEKAQSLDGVKVQRKKFEIKAYVEQLKHLIEEEKFVPKNNHEFARQILKLVNQITSDESQKSKIINAYWKESYNEAFDEKNIAKKTQTKLF